VLESTEEAVWEAVPDSLTSLDTVGDLTLIQNVSDTVPIVLRNMQVYYLLYWYALVAEIVGES
jgi:hypothetical protein